MDWVAQRHCEVFIFVDVQKPTGHDPEQFALADSILRDLTYSVIL